MKKVLQKIKGVKSIRVILLISLIISVSSCDKSPTATKNTETSQVAIANYLAAQKNPDLSDEEKIKMTIDTYFTLRYEAQKSIAAQDFSPLVEDNTLDWVQKERDKQEIELYKACMFDTGYQSYKFDLDYSSIEIKKQVDINYTANGKNSLDSPEAEKCQSIIHY